VLRTFSVAKNPRPNKIFPILFGASADATDDAWAVGFHGSDNIGTSAMHWDGTTWKSVATPNVGEGTNKLNAVLALAPNDVWAVGFSTPVAPPKRAATEISHNPAAAYAVPLAKKKLS
jgi:hypothetical protein